MQMNESKNGEWHWFKGGVIVSLLAMATYVVFQALSYKSYPFGITASFGSIATVFQYPFASLAENPVIQKYANSPAALISITMLFSVALGGFAAAKMNNTYAPEIIPAVWKKYHGPALWKRYLTVIVGGFFLGWGSVLASGCTTGNILQGWAHLSLGSLVAGASFFITGIIVAKILYPKAGGQKS
ncbi:MAG: YeeE/YedE family protein [Bacteroidales bacterium]|nr:YeeE/YedE family protein [Bacteroidales bacterium]